MEDEPQMTVRELLEAVDGLLADVRDPMEAAALSARPYAVVAIAAVAGLSAGPVLASMRAVDNVDRERPDGAEALVTELYKAIDVASGALNAVLRLAERHDELWGKSDG